MGADRERFCDYCKHYMQDYDLCTLSGRKPAFESKCLKYEAKQDAPGNDAPFATEDAKQSATENAIDSTTKIKQNKTKKPEKKSDDEFTVFKIIRIIVLFVILLCWLFSGKCEGPSGAIVWLKETLGGQSQFQSLGKDGINVKVNPDLFKDTNPLNSMPRPTPSSGHGTSTGSKTESILNTDGPKVDSVSKSVYETQKFLPKSTPIVNPSTGRSLLPPSGSMGVTMSPAQSSSGQSWKARNYFEAETNSQKVYK